MNIHDVEQVTTTQFLQDCNELLSLGWRLISTHTRLRGEANGTDKPGDLFQVYTLGWPHAEKEPAFPEGYKPTGD